VIHKHINPIWNKEELPQQWKESITIPVYREGDKIGCSNYRGILLLVTTYKIVSNILVPNLTPYVDKLLGIVNCDFEVSVELLIRYFVFVRYWRKWEFNGTLYQLFKDTVKVCKNSP